MHEHPLILLQNRLQHSPTLRGVLEWPEWTAVIDWAVATKVELVRSRAELLGSERLEVAK